MKTWLSLTLLGSLLLMAIAAAPQPQKPMLAHNVFFKLKDPSVAARQKLVNACQTYLADHPGTVFFAAGILADEYDREVNDRNFDVALHLVFTDKAAHDQYQTAPKHQQFIQEHRDTWQSVRVFDSWVKPAGAQAKPAPPGIGQP